VKAPDDFSKGVALCCAGSVIMVAVVFVGIMGYVEDLLPLIAFSLFLHVSGLVLVAMGVLLERLRAPRRMYYDWGL